MTRPLSVEEGRALLAQQARGPGKSKARPQTAATSAPTGRTRPDTPPSHAGTAEVAKMREVEAKTFRNPPARFGSCESPHYPGLHTLRFVCLTPEQAESITNHALQLGITEH